LMADQAWTIAARILKCLGATVRFMKLYVGTR
jgi:hypothetical protein